MEFIKYLFSLCLLVNHNSAVHGNDSRKELLKFFIEPILVNTSGITAECRSESDSYKQALLNAETWAVQMYDATEKIPFGVLSGNYMHLGNYDQCLEVKSDSGIIGKACIASINFTFLKSPQKGNSTTTLSPFLEAAISKFRTKHDNVNLPYQWLWCLPSSCGPQDILNTLETVFEELKNDSSIKVDIVINDDACATAKSSRPSLDSGDWCYLSVVIVIGLAVALSTAYDLLTLKKSEVNYKDTKYIVMTSFSLYTNGKSLFSTKSNSDALRSLYAIRFLSICFVAYFHSFAVHFFTSPWNLSDFIAARRSWMGPVVPNFVLAVDAFLLLGGIVLVYTEVGRHEKNAEGYRLNVPMFYFHRYMRITPSYIMIVGLYATIFRFFGSGPIWNELIRGVRDSTRNGWWRHPLYIINFFGVSRGLPQSWYLALDMQLYWIAPIFLYPLLFKGIRHISTIAIFSTGIAISVLSTFFITFFCELPDLPIRLGLPEFSIDADQQEIYQNYIYHPVYARMGSFFLGGVLGYFIRQWEKNPPKIALIWIICGWTIAILAFIGVIFGPTTLRYYDEGYNRIAAAFYGGFHRIVFASVIGWIVFATEFGYGGPIGNFLKWPGWMPLGKLTFSIYLSHFMVIFYDLGSMRTPPSISTWDLIRDFMAYMVITMIPATLLCLCFEMPFGKLTRLFTRKTDIKNVPKKNPDEKINSGNMFANDENDQLNEANSETIESGRRN